MKDFLKKRGDQVLAILLALLFFGLMLILSSCMSFDKAKRKFGNKSVEIEQIPFRKTIAPDSTMLQIPLSEIVPNRPIHVKGFRSGITIGVDASGNLSAVASADPIYIIDSIPYPVEKLVFREADMGKFVLRDIAEQEKEQAVKLAVIEAQIRFENKANNLSFFGKIQKTVEDVSTWLFWLLILVLILLFVLRKVLNRFFPLLLLICFFGCTSLDISKPFVVEGVMHEEGSVYYNLSQEKRNGKKQYITIEEQAGKKTLFDTVFLEIRDIKFLDK